MMFAIKRWFQTGFIALCFSILAWSVGAVSVISPAHALPTSAMPIAMLPQGDAITDGSAILRYALPIDNQAIRKIQKSLEEIATPLRISRKRLSAINGSLSQVDRILNSQPDKLLVDIPADRQDAAQDLIDSLKEQMLEIHAAVDQDDRETVWTIRRTLLASVGDLEALMVKEFPFEVPEEYSSLPQLKGRATVEIETTKGTMIAVVDGYSAPVTAGNFIDLVQRKFYDGLGFNRAEEFYLFQTGDPPGDAYGFVDPKTGDYRTIPLEILVQGDEAPTYEITLEEAGRYLDQPALPFSAYGAMAMAPPVSDPNGASSQFFFFLFERELTPPGFNLLDGRYAVFGYVTEGTEVLETLKPDDIINSIRVISGAENLVPGQA
jgi:peptidylprolyl isomerase